MKVKKEQLKQFYQNNVKVFFNDLPDIIEIEIESEQRTGNQNRGLHLLFKQISDDCMEKGIDMRQIVREEVPIQCTPENIKWLWKLMQQGLFKKKSTTELKKTGEIEIVYDNFNKVLIERTKGEISLPPFPSLEQATKELGVEVPEYDSSEIRI